MASLFSSGSTHDTVYEVVHSLRRRVNWRYRLMTSAANNTPTTPGGSSDNWLVRELGNFWNEAQVWQE